MTDQDREIRQSVMKLRDAMGELEASLLDDEERFTVFHKIINLLLAENVKWDIPPGLKKGIEKYID